MKQRQPIFFSAEKMIANPKYMYLDIVREALRYLLEHEMPPEVVQVCEQQGWIFNGEWDFKPLCKHDTIRLYCTIKNLLNNAKP